jgi:Helix-turn-helix domain
MSDKPENAKPAWAGGAYQSEITAVNVTVSRLTVKQNSKLLFVHSVVDDAQLDIESFRVFAHIVRRANGSGIAFPSVKSAAKVCKLNKDTISKRLKKLCERGWLQKVRRKGLPSGYEICWGVIRQEGISDKRGYPSLAGGLSDKRGQEVIRREGTEGNPVKVIQEDDSSTGSKNRPSHPLAAKLHLVDEEHIRALKEIYQPKDVDRAIAKMKAWLRTPKGANKQETKRRLQTFLCDAEPISAEKPKRKGAVTPSAPTPQEQPISVEEQQELAAELARRKAQLYKQMQAS